MPPRSNLTTGFSFQRPDFNFRLPMPHQQTGQWKRKWREIPTRATLTGTKSIPMFEFFHRSKIIVAVKSIQSPIIFYRSASFVILHASIYRATWIFKT